MQLFVIYYSKMLGMLEKEIKWSLFQAAKVLNFFGYDKFEDFYYEEGINEIKKTSKFIQKSNVFSYTILRSIILFNLNDYLGLCIKFNPKLLLLKENIPQIEKINFIKKTIPKYLLYINQIMELIKKEKDNNFIYKTMRLTCIE